MRLPLGGQFPYLPNNFNTLNDGKLQPATGMNPQETRVDYHVNGSFEAPRQGYDSNQHGWASTSGPCAVTMFDEHLYAQPNFPQVHFGFT